MVLFSAIGSLFVSKRSQGQISGKKIQADFLHTRMKRQIQRGRGGFLAYLEKELYEVSKGAGVCGHYHR